MPVDDNITPPPPPSFSSMEKAFGVTNIKTHVPLIMDLDQLNYDAWSELFTTYCYSFGVLGFLDGTIVYTSNDANDWKKLDSLVKKIKVSTDLLSNIDDAVDEKTLVMYAINGLVDRYDHVASIIRHRPKRPTLFETRSMLLLEESRLNRKQNRPHTGDNSSSPTVLVASSKPNPPKTNPKEVCKNFQRGNCRFGAKCRYLNSRDNKQVMQQQSWNGQTSWNEQNGNFGGQHMVCGPTCHPVRGPRPVYYGSSHTQHAFGPSGPFLATPTTSISGPRPGAPGYWEYGPN
ncbi:hypothetical protein CTI12_AA231450 [Artemisia annua]|uniref:C3H1-type domain-containing protein n=1 Tax=Artemisia annua TaxID=35608 RepID=A0A2U1NN85_ARTAN|nr:hypothetical protein CTI12_AA231450 [Artemisia annua]